MSTATATHHRFPHPIALAAAATVVVVGGATAIGIAVSQDDATTPTHSQVSSTSANHQCPSNKCLPQQARGGNANSRSIDMKLRGHDQVPTPVGGRTVQGLP